MMKFADRLVGKGLDEWVIIKLVSYNLAWMVVLVVPMAALVSTLMAFGSMSQNNEITIVKASGISLFRMMIAPIFASAVIAYLLILFNDDVLPDANHEAKILLEDISRQKPTLSLEPGIFSQEVSNYAILVRGMDQHSNEIYGVTIYDYTEPSKINIVTAEKGNLYFSKDQSKLIMELHQGEIHESDALRSKLYRKLTFNDHRITMNAEQFSFQQSAPGSGQRGDRELSTSDMLVIVDSLRAQRVLYDSLAVIEINRYMYKDSLALGVPTSLGYSDESQILAKAIEKVRANKNIIISNSRRSDYYQTEINRYFVEIHKKYAIPVACVVFVLIGAPLGVMVRKGGFGVAGGISLFFFLIYWAFLIGGEKLADRDKISPFVGMWSANIILLFVGIYLIIRSMKETVLIKFDFLLRLLPKRFRSSEVNSGTDEQ